MSGDRSNELYVKALQAEMHRTAERYRLAATAQPATRKLAISIHIYRPALAWFGRILVETGERLQKQPQADRAATS
jgi:hypothetical protein